MAEKARILVVDDEMGPRESLRMILKPYYEVHTAESAEAALREISLFRPDLVFMDIKMPIMDGVEALRRIKAQDPSIEVVMIGDYETVKSALTHGAFEYLVKPFSRQDLEETARRALEWRNAESSYDAQAAKRMKLTRLKETYFTPAGRDDRVKRALNALAAPGPSFRLSQEMWRWIAEEIDIEDA